MKPKKIKTAQTIKVLNRAAKIIEKGWSREWFARDKYGKPLKSSSDPRGAKFCAIGAIIKACEKMEDPYSASQDARTALAHHLNLRYGVAEWNDYQKSKKHVIEGFKLTVKSLKAQEK